MTRGLSEPFHAAKADTQLWKKGAVLTECSDPEGSSLVSAVVAALNSATRCLNMKKKMGSSQAFISASRASPCYYGDGPWPASG